MTPWCLGRDWIVGRGRAVLGSWRGGGGIGIPGEADGVQESSCLTRNQKTLRLLDFLVWEMIAGAGRAVRGLKRVAGRRQAVWTIEGKTRGRGR